MSNNYDIRFGIFAKVELNRNYIEYILNDGHYTYDFENEEYLDNQETIWSLMNNRCAEFMDEHLTRENEENEFWTDVKDTFDDILEELSIDINTHE